MFRKPKRKAKAALRHSSDDKKNDDTNDDRAFDRQHATNDEDVDAQHPLRYNTKQDESDDEATSALLSEVRKRTRPSGKGTAGVSGTADAATTATERSGAGTGAVMHSYRSTDAPTRPTGAELATRAAEHHAVASSSASAAVSTAVAASRGADGIFRDKTRNAFAAGPIRAQTNVRVTARFDYQPDVCKDYKDTGFCGYGDTCIYLHDRGDSMTGWQLEQQWEEQQKQKQQDQVLQAFVDLHSDSGRSSDRAAITGGAGEVPVGIDDGIPFACHICRGAFQDPVVTKCQHYLCETCILQHVREVSEACPICGKDTSSIFNQPNKLLAKKRRLVGAKASWQEFLDKFTAGTATSES